jgi:hypothetical protein
MRCSYYPQSLVRIRGVNREMDLEKLTRGFCSSRAAKAPLVRPVLVTGLTSASPLWDFCLR